MLKNITCRYCCSITYIILNVEVLFMIYIIISINKTCTYTSSKMKAVVDIFRFIWKKTQLLCVKRRSSFWRLSPPGHTAPFFPMCFRSLVDSNKERCTIHRNIDILLTYMGRKLCQCIFTNNYREVVTFEHSHIKLHVFSYYTQPYV